MPTGAQAAKAPRFSLQLQAGYSGVGSAGQWLPATLDVTNRGRDFTGNITIGASGTSNRFNAGNGQDSASQVEHQLAAVLPAGATKRFTTFVQAGPSPVVARLFTKGREQVASARSEITTANGPLIAVISDQGDALDEFGLVRLPGEVPVRVIHIKPVEVPESGIVLKAFDIVAVTNASTDAFNKTQGQALAEYAEQGGNLLVTGGSNWRKTIAGIPGGLLALKIDETRSVPDLSEVRAVVEAPALPGPVDVASGKLEVAGPREQGSAPAIIFQEAGLPLLVESAVGSGRVMFFGADPSQAPLLSWAGTRPLLRQITLRLLSNRLNNFTGGFNGAGMGMNPSASSQLAQAVSNISSLDLPSGKLLGILLVLYIFLVGPGNYLFLRRAGKRDLAWVTIPVVVLISSVAAYGVGLAKAGSNTIVNRVQILHATTGPGPAFSQSAVGVFGPRSGSYTIEHQGRSFVSSLGGQTFSIMSAKGVAPEEGGSGYPTGNVIVDEGSGVIQLNGDESSSRGYFEESFVKLPGGITENLKIQNGRIRGTVYNKLSFNIEEAVAVAGDSFVKIGKMNRDSPVSLDLPLARPSPFQEGGNLAYQIYGPREGIGSAGTVAVREQTRRMQILQSILPNDPSQSSEPMLIAWAKVKGETIRVNGSETKIQDLTAIVVPLKATPGQSLEGGESRANLVDVSGQFQTYGQTLSLPADAKAIYEIRLPGANWKNLKVRFSNELTPLAQKLGSVPAPMQVPPPPLPAPAPAGMPAPNSIVPPAPAACKQAGNETICSSSSVIPNTPPGQGPTQGPGINRMDVSVFNYGGQTWDPVTLTPGSGADEIKLDQPSYLSPAGLLRYRISAKPGGSLVGPASLSADPAS